jgi:hypothetical protein
MRVDDMILTTVQYREAPDCDVLEAINHD